MDVAAGLAEVRRRIAAACARSGRDPRSIGLVAVSKGHEAEAARAAVALGQRELGENRVQELVKKSRDLAGSSVRWHFIGSLQTNKVKDLLRCEGLVLVHSLDRVALADEIEKGCAALDRSLECLVQVHAADDPRKHGVAVEEAEALVRHVEEKSRHIVVRGLMTMAPLEDDASLSGARKAFQKTRELADRLRAARFSRASFEVLSMGMTGDLEVAIEEGSTLVRVGTAVFGPRN